MNKRRIENRLIKVHREWTDSIQDKKVQALARENCIITGGAITSLLLNEEPKDYDIYFRDRETVLAIANYYAEVANVVFGSEHVKVYSGKQWLDDYRKAIDAGKSPGDLPWYLP